MMSCPYCEGTPILMQHTAVFDHHQYSTYRVMCSSCGASTLDSCTRNAAKWAWDMGNVMRMTILEGPDIDEVNG